MFLSVKGVKMKAILQRVRVMTSKGEEQINRREKTALPSLTPKPGVREAENRWQTTNWR